MTRSSSCLAKFERRRIGATMVAALTVAAFVVPGALALPAHAVDVTSNYVAITPSRIADTRSIAPIDANTSRDFQITGSLVPANATAAVLNIT
ncbi:MAG: hypothetical protein ABWZ42_08005, partial [Ilumatobacteraceae bacterium]